MGSIRDYGRGRDWVIGSRIRERRLELDLLQRELCSRLAASGLAMSVPRLSQIEKGSTVDPGKLLAFAAALECSLTYLMGVTTDPAKWEPDEPLHVALTRVKRKGNVPTLRLAHST